MSTLLYRIGKTAYRRPWYVIGAWLVLLAVIVTALSAGTVRVSSEIRIDGTPAQVVLDELAARLPAASGGQASFVFQARQGERIDSPRNATAVAAAIDNIYGIDHVIDPRKLLAAHNGPTPSAAASPAVPADQGRAVGGWWATGPGGGGLLERAGRDASGPVHHADLRVAHRHGGQGRLGR